MKLIKRLYLGITAVGLVLVNHPNAAIAGTTSAPRWLMGDWNCYHMGVPATMRWEVKSVGNCGENCSSSEVATIGEFRPIGFPAIQSLGYGSNVSNRSVKIYSSRESSSILEFDDSTGIMSSRDFRGGLQCVKSPNFPPAPGSTSSTPVPPPVVKLPEPSTPVAPPVEKTPEPSTPVTPPVVKPQKPSVDAVEANPSTFAKWCKGRGYYTKATQLTIDVLLEKAGTDDCQQADSKLRNLEKLDLSNNKISDLRPISVFTNLRTLNLSKNQISDLQPLTKLKGLDALYLSGNQIRNLNSLKTIDRLYRLNLDGNQIRNIEPLKGLQLLAILNLSNNKISSLQPFSRDVKLHDLRNLDLSNNEIQDLSPLAAGADRMKKLIELDLSQNKIVDVDPLVKLNTLNYVMLRHNAIGDLQPLGSLINLKRIDLSKDQSHLKCPNQINRKFFCRTYEQDR